MKLETTHRRSRTVTIDEMVDLVRREAACVLGCSPDELAIERLTEGYYDEFAGVVVSHTTVTAEDIGDPQ